MFTTEFAVTARAGLGSLFISDATVLVRPRKVPGQYPASVSHDTAHAYDILCLGDDMGQYVTHIISQLSPEETHRLLDRVFYAYVDACCSELWCNARVGYIVDDDTVRVEEYGFTDGEYTMAFKVYCGIADDQTEELLAKLTASETDLYFVVRPQANEPGYTLHGFEVEPGEGDDTWYDEDDISEDEDPLAGDVEPTGGYPEPPMHPADAHRLSVMRSHGDVTG